MQICTVYAFISAIELPRIPAYLPKINLAQTKLIKTNRSLREMAWLHRDIREFRSSLRWRRSLQIILRMFLGFFTELVEKDAVLSDVIYRYQLTQKIKCRIL